MVDDYGLLGIQGLAADFVVCDRIMNERMMTLETEFGHQISRNCHPANLVRTRESLIRSSSAIRNGK